MKKALITVSIFVISLLAIQFAGVTMSAAASGATVDPALEAALASRVVGATVPAVITYDHKPSAADFAHLQSLGITKGFALREIPMVITDLNLAQLSTVRTRSGVVSVWGNEMMQNFTNASLRFIGVPQMMADQEVTKRNANNPGLPVSGKGIGIGYVDTGIDGTQADLQSGRKTVQNVQQPLANGVVSTGGLVSAPGVSISDLIAGTGFVAPIYVENVPTSDIESGHGTRRGRGGRHGAELRRLLQRRGARRAPHRRPVWR